MSCTVIISFPKFYIKISNIWPQIPSNILSNLSGKEWGLGQVSFLAKDEMGTERGNRGNARDRGRGTCQGWCPDLILFFPSSDQEFNGFHLPPPTPRASFPPLLVFRSASSGPGPLPTTPRPWCRCRATPHTAPCLCAPRCSGLVPASSARSWPCPPGPPWGHSAARCCPPGPWWWVCQVGNKAISN